MGKAAGRWVVFVNEILGSFSENVIALGFLDLKHVDVLLFINNTLYTKSCIQCVFS